MKEREWAAVLGRQVDGMLARAGRCPEAEVVPIESARDLALARELVQADFTRESRVLPALGARLAADAATVRRDPSSRRRGAWRSWARLLPLGAAAAAVAALILAGGLGDRPAGMPAAARPAVAAPQHIASIEDARAALPGVTVVMPGALPAGYYLRDILVSANGQGYTAVYSSDRRADIVFCAVPAALPAPRYVGLYVAVARRPDEVSWTATRQLAWNTGTMRFSVGGLDLTAEEALAIARSVP